MGKTPRTYAARKEAAFQAGLAAFRAGKAVTDCPILKHQGLKTAWREGWVSGSSEREKQTSGMFIVRQQPGERAPAEVSLQRASG